MKFRGLFYAFCLFSLTSQGENIVIGGSPVFVDTDLTAPVVLLALANGANGYGICTGTFVNRSTILTAAHCLEDNPKVVGVKGNGITSTYFVNKSYEELKQKLETSQKDLEKFKKTHGALLNKIARSATTKDLSKSEVDDYREMERLYQEVQENFNETERNDIAVVVLPQKSAVKNKLKNFYSIAKEDKPSRGEYAMIIGYGASKLDPKDKAQPFTEAGEKNLGAVKIYAAMDGFFQTLWTETKKVPFIGPGDSGGPLIKCKNPGQAPKGLQDCNTYEIAGINVTVTSYDINGELKMVSNSVDITTPEAREFYDTTIHCKTGQCAEPF